MLKVGDLAPLFELPDADLEMVKLADFVGAQTIVLYFYPHDDTPGCTLEAIEFSDHVEDFQRLETVILGVSLDDCLSHGAFRDKHGLAIRLLADADGDVTRAYGVLHEREVDGEVRYSAIRSTFVIGRDGRFKYARDHVTPRGHALEILHFIKEMIC